MKRLLFIMTVILSSCHEDVDPGELNPDYIIFGHFYGECLGEGCIEIYKLTDSELYEDTNDTYPSFSAPYNGNFVLLDHSLFEKVKDLGAHIPPELFETGSGVIGQPDAGDWGGVYFEIATNGDIRYWLIDKMRTNIPESLHGFVDEIENNIELINQ